MDIHLSTHAAKKSVRAKVLYGMKLLFGVGLLLTLLLWNGNWKRVVEAFVNANPWYLIRMAL